MAAKKSAGGSVRTLRILLGSLTVLIVSFGVLVGVAYSPPSLAPALTLDQVYDLGAKGNIRFAKLLDEDAVVIVQVCTDKSNVSAPVAAQPTGPGPSSSQEIQAQPGPIAPPAAAQEPTAPVTPAPVKRQACTPPLKPFQASYPRSDVGTPQLIEKLASGGASVVVEKQTPMTIIKLLLTFMFPLLVLANLFGLIFVAKGGDSTMADIAGFGKMGKKAKGGGKEGKNGDRPSTGVTFADVGGAEEALVELKEVTDYLKDPKKFEAYGASAPKGVLLFGPPGCGKTLLARAVAGEAGVPFFPVSGAEFIESLVGVGAARVRDLFAQVKLVAPAIVFIDEIDAVGRKRSGEGSTGGEREQTVNQLLVEMDGFEVTAGIVLMGATNRPDILDPALMRPGRFDRHVTLETPDVHGRQVILELHAKGKPIAEGVDFEHLARRTPGFTGADLANVINEGALLALRKGPETRIGTQELTEAIQRVLHGPMRRGTLMSPEERNRLAYHESGHALVAAALGQAEGVQRVSIVARGRSLGSSAFLEQADRVLLTDDEMSATLAITMGGVAAERVVFGNSSSTSKDDLAKANALAKEMVGMLGMSEEVGPLRVLSTEGGYLGSDAKLAEAVSGQTLGLFDLEVKSLIEKAQAQAAVVVAANRAPLDRMAAALKDQETLEGVTLQELLAAARPGPADPAAGPGVNGRPGSSSQTRSTARPARTTKP